MQIICTHWAGDGERTENIRNRFPITLCSSSQVAVILLILVSFWASAYCVYCLKFLYSTQNMVQLLSRTLSNTMAQNSLMTECNILFRASILTAVLPMYNGMTKFCLWKDKICLKQELWSRISTRIEICWELTIPDRENTLTSEKLRIVFGKQFHATFLVLKFFSFANMVMLSFVSDFFFFIRSFIFGLRKTNKNIQNCSGLKTITKHVGLNRFCNKCSNSQQIS